MSDNLDKTNRQLQVLWTKAEAQQPVSAKPAKKVVLAAYELLHELRVHQTELKMQSEELRRAHVALQTLCTDYIELYNCRLSHTHRTKMA